MNISAFDSIYGNAPLKDYIRRNIDSGAFPHAVIIEGGEGSGKKTVSRLIASALACRAEKKPCMECNICRKISEDICPDVVFYGVKNGKKTIGVDTVRELREDVCIKSNELDVKVYVICDAHLMTNGAQNAFLKILEEPPSGVYFLLLTERVSALLATVRSRAQLVRMQQFSADELEKYLLNSEKAMKIRRENEEFYLEALRRSEGTIGRLNECLFGEDSSEKSYEWVCEYMDLLAQNSCGPLVAYSVSSNLKREELSDRVELICTAIRDIIAAKKGNGDMMFYTSRQRASKLASSFTLKSLLDMYDIASEIYGDLSSGVNLNVVNTATVLLMKLWSAK